jgi:hypothetical protein
MPFNMRITGLAGKAHMIGAGMRRKLAPACAQSPQGAERRAARGIAVRKTAMASAIAMSRPPVARSYVSVCPSEQTDSVGVISLKRRFWRTPSPLRNLNQQPNPINQF